MHIVAKIKNPICIRLGNAANALLVDDANNQSIPLVPGVMFGDEHYGFVLIIDVNGRQKEVVYPTRCRIDAVGIENGILKIFEEGKSSSWRFAKSGKLEHSIFGEFTDEYRSKFNIVVEHDTLFLGQPIFKNPLRVKIVENSEKSMILKDEFILQDFPLYPGIVLGTEHYGFILIIDVNGRQKEVYYPTQNKIDSIGIEGDVFGDLKVFEYGKYHPWIFSSDGEFKQEASYNPYSRRDRAFVEDVYDLNMEEATDRFTLSVKK